MKEKLHRWMVKNKVLAWIMFSVFLCVVYSMVFYKLQASVIVIVIIDILLTALTYAYVELTPGLILEKALRELEDNCDPYPLKQELEFVLSYKNSETMQQNMMINYALVFRSLGEYEKNYEMLRDIHIDKNPGTLPMTKVVYYNNLMDACMNLCRYTEACVWYEKMKQIYADMRTSKQKEELELTVEAAEAVVAFCGQEYQKCMELLDKSISKSLRMKVDYTMMYARAAVLAGDMKMAREKLEYVMEKGNKLYCVTEAKQLLDEHCSNFS